MLKCKAQPQTIHGHTIDGYLRYSALVLISAKLHEIQPIRIGWLECFDLTNWWSEAFGVLLGVVPSYGMGAELMDIA